MSSGPPQNLNPHKPPTFWRTAWDTPLKSLHPTLTQQQLANHFGVSRSTLDKRCRVLGLKKGQRKAVVDTEEVRERLLLDQSVRQIADELGIHRSVIIRTVRSMGNVYTSNLRRRGYR